MVTGASSGTIRSLSFGSVVPIRRLVAHMRGRPSLEQSHT